MKKGFNNNMRYAEWRFDDELAYIDDKVNALPLNERQPWLERYLTACLHRADWGPIDGQKVINYIERKLIDILNRWRG